MQDQFFAALRSAISNERFDVCRRADSESELDMLCRYAWNVALSEALYPALQNLEVVLRNSVHSAATQAFNNVLWFDTRPATLRPQEQQVVERAKSNLRSHGRPLAAGRLIAELTFGFWTSLFNRRYEQVLWPRLLEDTFPYMSRRDRTRPTLSRRLERIRHLRNRVFHHERVWHWRDLQQQHAELLETIAWISPAVHDITQVLNRFPDVYNQGSNSYKVQLAHLVTTFTQGS